MAEPEIHIENARQRRTLLIVLALNLLLFMALAVTGFLADSSALIANAIDNLSDTAVYAISWYAVGKPPRAKQRAAQFSGVMLIVFAVLVLADAARRPFMGPEPLGMTMVVMAAVAAAVNLLCLRLIKPLESQDVNMKAAETFSANDFVANAGIVVAGVLVMWTNSFWPDVAVGVVVALVALKGGLEILKDAGRDASSS
jgi:cobalt-zinc-cadmium efflux system protein